MASSSGLEQAHQFAFAIQLSQFLEATDVQPVDENLGHGASPRLPDHFLAQRRIQVHAQLLDRSDSAR